MSIQQYGVVLYGAKEPLWVISEWRTLDDFAHWMNNRKDKLVEVQIVGQDAPSALINPDFIVAVSGPSAPGVAEMFKK